MMQPRFVVWALSARHALADSGEDSVSIRLNGYISTGSSGLYTGGKGIFVRNPFDDLEHGNRFVVPSTFWSNDLVAPSPFYPGSGGGGGDPWCPNDGSDGFFDDVATRIPCNPNSHGDDNPWNYAQMGYVVGSAMTAIYPDWDSVQDTDWGWGVFYPTDSNSVDKRCRWLESEGIYDCPGGYIPLGGSFVQDSNYGGTGYYPPGNPYAQGAMGPLGGGGTGCHFDTSRGAIDQMDAYDSSGNNLVKNADCECNYDLIGDDGFDWVWNWINNAEPKPGFVPMLGSSGEKVPSWALDISMCWTNNLRDMIKVSNALYWSRLDWSNQKVPGSQWGTDPASLRLYWGWNEIPSDRVKLTNPHNWDTIMIKLPAAICGGDGGDDSVWCLSDGAQQTLGQDLQSWTNAGYLVPGYDNISKRPGSYVVFVKEFMDQWYKWQRVFYCEDFSHWSSSIKIVFNGDVDACYAEWGSASDSIV